MQLESNFMYDTEERIAIWFDMLLEATGKKAREDLTAAELASELAEVKGTIANEQLWAASKPIHVENVEILTVYLEELNALHEKALSKNQERPGSLDDVIRSCESLSKNGTAPDAKCLGQEFSSGRDL